MLICSVEGCNGEVSCRGVCQNHYMQLRRSGIVPSGTRARAPVEVRFWRYVNKTNDCWLWTSTKKTSKGYGQIGAGGVGGKNLLAHRLSYEMHHGEIPEGFVVMHKCDNPSCVNPDHLRLGTTSENVKEAYEKRRKVSPFKLGVSHHMSILDEEKVRFIRGNLDISAGVLGKKYGIARSAITAVRRNETWKHIE